MYVILHSYVIINLFTGWKNFIHIQKKFNKKGQGKQNKTKENYVQRTTIYNNHIDTQQCSKNNQEYIIMSNVIYKHHWIVIYYLNNLCLYDLFIIITEITCLAILLYKNNCTFKKY